MGQEFSDLDCFIQILPYMQCFFDDDISIAVTDREKFLSYYADRNLCIDVEPGRPIPEGGASIEVIRTGQPIIKDVPAHVYGTAFRSYAVPIRNKRCQLIGTVLLARSLELSNQVKKLTESTKQNASDLFDHIGQVMEQMPRLLKLNETILEKAEEIKVKSEDTKKILLTMQKISKQSNLLALNASIEAARAGVSGRGFTVVAKRIGELSKSTDASIRMAETIINDSLEPVEDINLKISNSNEVFEEQADSLKNINKIIQNITNEIQDLVRVLDKL